ncbi:hypothetical protein JK628_12065 [Shewanella sp. KX20019]|uniref:hypothetical protein n=1 Tax=Shewanella sp. KX20019 TaxID=2803864 RepID=UPI00192607BC|nr:hypothetical protein [Shewanella sp. KX20019]QQX78339.1 hypothetical protein JK628_12065 [Shewanella sp. KX20019]
MKRIVLASLISCIFASSAVAKDLEADAAIGMASLMICTTFYSENDMQIEGTIVGQSMMSHKNAGIEEMTMSKSTNDQLEAYMAKFKAASKEQKALLCNEAIEFARNSDFISQ